MIDRSRMTQGTAGLVALAAIAGAAMLVSRAGRAQPAPAPEVQAALAAGYLAQGAAPDSLAIAPPPAPGSAADAELRFPGAPDAFACALGVEVAAAATPALARLLRRSEADVRLATYPSQTKYPRTRPFVARGGACTPDQAAFLRGDGSHPSGHSAIGWGWALILTEAAPERAAALLARGRALGESRVVCHVHWPSDVDEGRMLAAATVARLHAEPAFRADLEAARAEIAAARARGAGPARDCAAEAAALAG